MPEVFAIPLHVALPGRVLHDIAESWRRIACWRSWSQRLLDVVDAAPPGRSGDSVLICRYNVSAHVDSSGSWFPVTVNAVNVLHGWSVLDWYCAARCGPCLRRHTYSRNVPEPISHLVCSYTGEPGLAVGQGWCLAGLGSHNVPEPISDPACSYTGEPGLASGQGRRLAGLLGQVRPQPVDLLTLLSDRITLVDLAPLRAQLGVRASMELLTGWCVTLPSADANYFAGAVLPELSNTDERQREIARVLEGLGVPAHILNGGARFSAANPPTTNMSAAIIGQEWQITRREAPRSDAEPAVDAQSADVDAVVSRRRVRDIIVTPRDVEG